MPSTALDDNAVADEATEDADHFFSHGRQLSEQESFDKAYRAFCRAVEIDPNHQSAWVHLGWVLDRKFKRFNDAEAAYRRALELEPRDAWTRARLGAVLGNKLERTHEGIDALREALEIEPDSVWAWVQLGWQFEKLGNYADAEKAYRRAYELDPKDGLAGGQIIRFVYKRLVRKDEALEILLDVMDRYGLGVRREGSSKGPRWMPIFLFVMIHRPALMAWICRPIAKRVAMLIGYVEPE